MDIEDLRDRDVVFQNFLSEIDIEFADYFTSTEFQSVTFSIATINGANLKIADRKLRPDIRDKIITKHKEIWGDLHQVISLD